MLPLIPITLQPIQYRKHSKTIKCYIIFFYHFSLKKKNHAIVGLVIDKQITDMAYRMNEERRSLDFNNIFRHERSLHIDKTLYI